MKTVKISILFAFILSIVACDKTEVLSPSIYDCQWTYNDSSSTHPKAAIYQQILEDNQKRGIVGASLLIVDKDGQWAGASGMADIENSVPLATCHAFPIASISKVFTATVVFSLIDDGIISIDDPVSDWVSEDINNRLANVNEAKISHLLSHTSGIPDYFSTQFELDRINKKFNNWRMADMLTYAYGLSPTNDVGATYYYSNSNYVLLGMIIEKASGKTITQMYNEKIFAPLNLQSAYYGTDIPIRQGTVKGYADIYGNGQFGHSAMLYKDEMNTPDGSIIINSFDLARFMNGLNKGELISQSSLDKMTEWFDIPEYWVWEAVGQSKNGFGFEYFEYEDNYATGHTGGIDGFSTYGFYYPEQDVTFILLMNSIGQDIQIVYDIINQSLAEALE